MCTSSATTPRLVRTISTGEDAYRVRKDGPDADTSTSSPSASTAAETRTPGSLSTSAAGSDVDAEGEVSLSPEQDTEGQPERTDQVAVAKSAPSAKSCAQGAGSAQAIAPGKDDFPYSLSDLKLVECFYNLSRLQDPHPETLKLLLRVVMLMRSCGYCMQDICVVLAHASIYFNDATKKCGNMAPGEAGNILALLIYMAHSYVQDEHCPLRFWHEYLFRSYCNIGTLDKALMCMMKLRNYILRVDLVEMQSRFFRLHACTSTASSRCHLDPLSHSAALERNPRT